MTFEEALPDLLGDGEDPTLVASYPVYRPGLVVIVFWGLVGAAVVGALFAAFVSGVPGDSGVRSVPFVVCLFSPFGFFIGVVLSGSMRWYHPGVAAHHVVVTDRPLLRFFESHETAGHRRSRLAGARVIAPGADCHVARLSETKLALWGEARGRPVHHVLKVEDSSRWWVALTRELGLEARPASEYRKYCRSLGSGGGDVTVGP